MSVGGNWFGCLMCVRLRKIPKSGIKSVPRASAEEDDFRTCFAMTKSWTGENFRVKSTYFEV